MIRCIATDMDGTLLGADQSISKENIEAILTAKKHGIEVVVSTGRAFESAHAILKEANLSCSLICMNGAQIRTFEGDVLLSIPLQSSLLPEIRSILEQKQIYYELYTNKGQFSYDYEQALVTIADIIFSSGHFESYEEVLRGVEKRFAQGNIEIVDNYDFVYSDPSIEIYKIIAFSLDKEKLTNTQNELGKITDIAVSSSGFENIEITNIEAQKGITLEKYVRSKGISLKETMAIGDSYNDISMFEKVGFAVAMGNAPDEIKQICDYVTDTNVEHGFSKAVYKVIEMNQNNGK